MQVEPHIQTFVQMLGLTSACSGPHLRRSRIQLENGTSVIDSTIRTSSTANLSPRDPVVTAIINRAADFQGFGPFRMIDVQVTSYQPSQEYRPHYDWRGETRTGPSDRISTFFAILESECTDCGTEFPGIAVNWTEEDRRWCEFMDCEKENLVTRNVPGAALYWRNLDEEGNPRMDMLHAGLPAKGGRKVGLNIWTEIYVDLPAEESDEASMADDKETEVQETEAGRE